MHTPCERNLDKEGKRPSPKGIVSAASDGALPDSASLIPALAWNVAKNLGVPSDHQCAVRRAKWRRARRACSAPFLVRGQERFRPACLPPSLGNIKAKVAPAASPPEVRTSASAAHPCPSSPQDGDGLLYYSAKIGCAPTPATSHRGLLLER